MIRAFLFFFAFIPLLSAQYYEEPAFGNFKFDLNKIEDKNTVAKELTDYLKAQNPEKLNYRMAEKIIALCLYLDGFNMNTLVLNASLKHNLQLKRSEPYNSLKISALLEERIKKDLYSKDKDKVAFAFYLTDIHREIVGEDKFPATKLEMDNAKVTASWENILKNYSAKKLVVTSTPAGSSAKVGVIAKEIHPDFKNKQKDLFQRQATVNGLMVSTNAQGVNNGIMSEVIGTATPASGPSTFSFTRQVGDSMKESLINAEKALKVRFPQIRDGYNINVSFSNKFSNKDGDSAGTAITVMLFSMFEGIEIDRTVAMTGTISPNWKVGIVGGVASKIRGAIKSKCRMVGIPIDNREAVQDLVILYGIENLWQIQVFRLSTLDQAIDLARKDKSANLEKAIVKFREVAKFIPKDMRFYQFSAKMKIVNMLKEVLSLAPNHMSARVLHDVIVGSSYLRLSFLTSVEEVNRLSSDILTDIKIPEQKVKATLQTLARYAKRVDKRVAPYATQIDVFLTSFKKLEGLVEDLNAKAKRGVRDQKQYEEYLVQKKRFDQDRELLIKYAKDIDKEVEVYLETMRAKYSNQ